MSPPSERSFNLMLGAIVCIGIAALAQLVAAVFKLWTLYQQGGAP